MFHVENLDFDGNLFGFRVGRIELACSGLTSSSHQVALAEALKDAYATGTNLIYLLAPTHSMRDGSPDPLSISKFTLPGIKTDAKTTYDLSLASFDASLFYQHVYAMNQDIHIRIENKAPVNTNNKLRDLAIASGEWSRFRVDTNIPSHVYAAIFEAWMNNSVNRSIADEVFVASIAATGEDVGFITVKRKGNMVNIGLLAVDANHRRKGIAKKLLSRAMIWAFEATGWDKHATMSVITQGANTTACACYESFGFHIATIQSVHHIWLPQHLIEPLSRSDRARLPFCKQHLTGKEQEYIAQVLASGLDSAARFTTMCATKLQEMLGPDCERMVMVPSGTAALEMAALLAELGPGDEVIMPSYTFSSTANAFVLRGAIPVFVDIRADTLNIDETLIEAAITSRTRAICCVHYAGIPCEMDAIMLIARRHGLYVIEDAAQAFMSQYNGRPIGTIGDFGCFSFHYTKNIICGEGGAISINRSPEHARRALVLWEKGTNRYDFMAGKLDKYEWVDIGSSYVPSEVSCAILFAQLEHASSITATRCDNYMRYYHGFASLMRSGIIRLPHIPCDCHHNAHIFYIIFSSYEHRIQAEEGFKMRGISAFSHYVPLHSSIAGKKYGRVSSSSSLISSSEHHDELMVTKAVYDGLLRLPMWIGMRLDELNYVIQAVHEICDQLQ